MRLFVLASLLTASPITATIDGFSEPVMRAPQDPVEDPRRELAHLAEWLLQVEARDASVEEHPEFNDRMRSVLESLGYPASDSASEEKLLGLLEDVFREHRPGALPLLALCRHTEGIDPTWDRLRELRSALGAYRERRGRYPALKEGLAALSVKDGLGGPYLEAGSLLDGWGREILYGVWDEGSYELRSVGADGQPDNADDLVGDESGLHRDDPARVLGSSVVGTAIAEIKVDQYTVLVRLDAVTHHRHWDIALDRKERTPLRTGDEVKVTVDDFSNGPRVTTEAEGWVRFNVDPTVLVKRFQRGQGGMIFRFHLVGSRFGAPGMRLGQDWAMGVVDKAIEGTPAERLARWEGILADVPRTETGDALRHGIESFLEPLREQHRMERERVALELSRARIERAAQIEAAGGLDPRTSAARAECMRLQVHLAETCLAAGDPQAAARAFGDAARHASDNDDLDALEMLIERQLDAQEAGR